MLKCCIGTNWYFISMNVYNYLTLFWIWAKIRVKSFQVSNFCDFMFIPPGKWEESWIQFSVTFFTYGKHFQIFFCTLLSLKFYIWKNKNLVSTISSFSELSDVGVCHMSGHVLHCYFPCLFQCNPLGCITEFTC